MRLQIQKNFYWNYDSHLINNEFTKETLHNYTKLIMRRENAVKQYPVENFNKIRNCHDNCYKDPKISKKAVDSYIDFINSPETADAQSYMFNSIESFKWPENYFQKFVEGFKKYREIIVNNEKIAAYMGENVSANQVKYVKQKFLRNLKQVAKKNEISLNDQLATDLENYTFENSFPWLSQTNIIQA